MSELPTTFGKYFLTEKLATGGMAEIYLAKLVGPGGFEKSLVIKQIHPRLTGQRQFVDLFVAEAKTLVTLAHGNIVPVYELGVVDDTYFIAMEYIDGPTLYRLTATLARREVMMAPPLAAWIAARILDGLDYAHRKGEGVIHRDLSPRNVMLSRDGEVKLVDFGIAIAHGAADAATGDAPTGSFPYMSPEQVRRRALTGQSDLFSLGVLLWEMLVGRRLFARADEATTLAAVIEGDIARPSADRPEIPARLDEVVMRALARDPSERWATASDMLAALQRYLYALDEPPGPRDLAALVARYCPPETRRHPTHSELGGSSEPPPAPAGPRTAVVPRTAMVPRTAVVPRDAAVRGKARARTETFATHVELEQLLAPEVPVVDAAAVGVDEAAVGRMVRTAPSRALLVLAATGALGLGVAAVVIVMTGRSKLAGAPDAGSLDGSVGDAASLRGAAVDARVDATVMDDAAVNATGADAPGRDAGPVDATPDARVPIATPVAPRDAPAAFRERPDAAPESPRLTGTATLVIGADPWGEITVDGAPRGRTPARLSITPGKHTVEVSYRGDEAPRSKTFAIDLAAGAVRELQADFSAP